MGTKPSLAALVLLSTPLFGQNLVVNPSFEITTTNCGSFGGEGFFTDLTGSWDNASNNALGDSCSSPDLFSACNIFATGVPNSLLGFQYARTGTRYAGIITHEVLDQYREYIQGRTVTPLVAGQTYCVSMYVSKADGVPFATNNIGIRFSSTQFLRDPCPGQNNSLIDLPPDLNYACAAIIDTVDWVRLQWDYQAVGGESFFTIGNFFNNANTIIQNVGGNFLNPFAYYFIDDVSIVPNSCCYADLTGTLTYCLNDGATDLGAVGGIGANCSNAVQGTWSGPGITDPAQGTFDPAVAGVGTHAVTFSMDCGFSATLQLTVGPCVGLAVCADPVTGALTVSNGVAPYTWQEEVQVQDCSACLFGCIIPPGCAVMVPAWSTFANGASIPAPSDFPIQVVDGVGTVLTLTDPGSIPSCTPCPAITVNVTDRTNVLCFGDATGSATVSATGGAGSPSYVWSPIGVNGPTATSLAAGSYSVTATDENGCTGQVAVTITGPAAPLNITVVDVTGATCAGGDGTSTISISGGTQAYAVEWSPSGATGTMATGLDAGVQTVFVTDANGCTAEVEVNVPSLDGPVLLEISSTASACAPPDGTITVLATGTGLEYALDGGPFQASELFIGVAGGMHTVAVQDANGCTITATVFVDAPIGPDPVISGSPFACAGDEVVLSTTEAFASYRWSTGAGTDQVVVVQSTFVTVTVTDADGCVGTSAPFAVQFEEPLAAFTTTPASPQPPGTTVVFEDASTISAGTLIGWSWDLGVIGGTAGTPDVSWTYDEPGQYTVTLVVQSTNGCVDTVSAIYVIGSLDISIPNVFTPNNDGKNDAFVIENIEFFPNELTIYNRWGAVIYSKKDYRNQWKGSDLSDGTYFYVLRLLDGREFTGHVTLLR
ncbi:MAG: gliding motility-associated C-terminal domain-containing protein [Flavobacteriales bacterium]|nr:gliding motility-associated C-terminal domain-containing protein [Flavobacteriales bacterium]